MKKLIMKTLTLNYRRSYNLSFLRNLGTSSLITNSQEKRMNGTYSLSPRPGFSPGSGSSEKVRRLQT